MLALKENHGELYEEVAVTFKHLEEAAYTDRTEQWDKNHGNIEFRKCFTVTLTLGT